MTARELLVILGSKGIAVTREGSRLRVSGAVEASPDELAELRLMKAELIEVLTTHPCAECSRGVFPNPGVVCFLCRNKARGQEAS